MNEKIFKETAFNVYFGVYEIVGVKFPERWKYLIEEANEFASESWIFQNFKDAGLASMNITEGEQGLFAVAYFNNPDDNIQEDIAYFKLAGEYPTPFELLKLKQNANNEIFEYFIDNYSDDWNLEGDETDDELLEMILEHIEQYKEG